MHYVTIRQEKRIDKLIDEITIRDISFRFTDSNYNSGAMQINRDDPTYSVIFTERVMPVQEELVNPVYILFVNDIAQVITSKKVNIGNFLKNYKPKDVSNLVFTVGKFTFSNNSNRLVWVDTEKISDPHTVVLARDIIKMKEDYDKINAKYLEAKQVYTELRNKRARMKAQYELMVTEYNSIPSNSTMSEKK